MRNIPSAVHTHNSATPNTCSFENLFIRPFVLLKFQRLSQHRAMTPVLVQHKAGI